MDWGGLLPELLEAILGKLTKCTDHLRFHCVCRSWQSAARSHQMPPFLPWLCFPPEPAATDLQLYSLADNKVYKIPLPEVYNSYIVHSASGFLLIIGRHENQKPLMFNPFTGTRAHLPSPCHQFSYFTRPDHSGSIFVRNYEFNRRVASDYSGSMVVGNYGCARGVAYCHPGEHSWSKIDALADRNIKSIIYKAGSFCILDSATAEVIFLNGETLDAIRIFKLPNYNHFGFDLVMSPDDNIQVRADLNGSYSTVLFNLNPQLEEPSWLEITHMGNYTLFDDEYWKYVFLTKASSNSRLRNTICTEIIFFNNLSEKAVCFIYERNIGSLISERKGNCSCSTYPFWILPNLGLIPHYSNESALSLRSSTMSLL